MFPTMTMTSEKVSHLVEMVNVVTGWDLTDEEAMRISWRTSTLCRAFNIRQGITPGVEKPSPRYGSAPIDGPLMGVSIMPHWEELLEGYYGHMGWDRKSGRPLPATLRMLGLENIIHDLWDEGPFPKVKEES
jgi:aldehyde:ferredoxin oxidoreductase